MHSKCIIINEIKPPSSRAELQWFPLFHIKEAMQIVKQIFAVCIPHL